MWVVAGILLGLVVLSALIGFHSGPHTHIASGVIGLVAAVWLVIMAVEGFSAPVLWALLSADVVVSAGVGVLAWKGLKAPPPALASHGAALLEGTEAVAVTDLNPEGIVRVRGESWSAVAVNGTIPAGQRVRVVRANGVRLEVWAEEVEDKDLPAAADLFKLPEGEKGKSS